MEQKYKDPTKYRGRGRPRKIDYSPFIELQRKLNSMMELAFERTLPVQGKGEKG